MKELHKLEHYDFDIVKSFIDNSIEESINIEFKSAGALSRKDADKKEVSKDVAAFANSDGGIIIYGIEEKNHKADSFSFINGNVFTKEWLEQIISSTIKRNIPELKIFPIRNNGRIEESIYVVQIPSSIEAPHLSRDKRFYKRAQFESVMMEEYEIRQLYGRKVKSKLVLDECLILPIKSGNTNEYVFDFEVGVVNNGEAPEKDYKVNVYFSEISNDFSVEWSRGGQSENYSYTKMGNRSVKITSEAHSTIYPNEFLNVIRFNFSLSKESILDKLDKIKIKIKLLYSGGEDDMEADLKLFKDKLDKLESLNNGY